MHRAKALIRSSDLRLIAGKLVIVAGLAIAVAELSVVAKADIAVLNLIHSLTTGWLTSLLFGVSELASTEVILAAMAAATAVLAAKGHWRGATALALSVLATQAVVTVAKDVISRPRPEDSGSMIDPSGFSFPSGHSASAVALYVMLALIAGSAVPKRLWAIAWLGAITLALTIGLSRVYLGAHYPSDVLAGWLTGGILVIASWALCSRLPVPARTPA